MTPRILWDWPAANDSWRRYRAEWLNMAFGYGHYLKKFQNRAPSHRMDDEDEANEEEYHHG